MNQPARQAEFTFANIPAARDGLATWHAQREEQSKALARKVGLPIGHPAEVWLTGGVRLQGVLRLRENLLLPPDSSADQLELEIQGMPFKIAEMESCVRLD